MVRSTSWITTASKIAAQKDLASVLIRLMLCNNDLSIVSNSLDEWSATKDQRKLGRKNGACLYFVRVLLSHVYEALLIIQEISRSPVLRAAVDTCDDETITSFKLVEGFALSKEMKSLRALRNRATFHYDLALPVTCLGEIAEYDPDGSFSYEQGRESLDWHFALADSVMDRMIVRKVYGLDVPKSPERREKLNAISLREQEVATAFTNFAAHFVRHYSK
jgi:hypothetical protein